MSLVVQSTPIAGIAIAGTPSGTTNYTSTMSICPGSQVTLTAPALIVRSGRSYWFVRWTVNGINQGRNSRVVSFGISGNTTVVAVYKYVRYLKITGPIRVIGGTTVSYACRAYYSIGGSNIVISSARWYENSRYARFIAPARLKTYVVRSAVNCRITVKYGGATKSLYIKILPR